MASKVITKRLEKVLTFLINPDQTGFIKGRYIGQNIRLINHILEQTKLCNIPGILLQLDFQKAFDTIEWEFIQIVLLLRAKNNQNCSFCDKSMKLPRFNNLFKVNIF